MGKPVGKKKKKPVEMPGHRWCIIRELTKGNQFRYRPGVAQRVPGS